MQRLSFIAAELVLFWLLANFPAGLPEAVGPSATAAEPSGVLQTPADRRVYRILTGRNEKSRENLVARIIASRDETHAQIDTLIAATQTLLDQRAEQIRTDTKPIVQSKPVADSILSLIAAIAVDPSPSVLPFINNAIAHEDELVSMAAMDAAGINGLRETIDALAAQIKRVEFDERYAYRFSLVRAIAQLHDPRAVERLQKLGKQLDGQLRHEIEERLASVDILDFRGDTEQLKAWQDENPMSEFLDQVFLDVEPIEPDQNLTDTIKLQAISSSSQQRPKLARSQYYGIDLNAGRMLFIIDRSGSMREPAHYGTRLQRAKTELIQTINGLARQTEFGIMAFDTTIQFFRDELLDASDENKREATMFVDRIGLGKKTNTHGALVDATEFHDQLEAVFLLTDGRPTYGKVTRPDWIIDEVVRRNRMRHLKFHTIGIGNLGSTVVFLKTLAEETGGEFRQVP